MKFDLVFVEIYGQKSRLTCSTTDALEPLFQIDPIRINLSDDGQAQAL